MTDLPLKEINEEVYLATDPIVRFDRRAIEFIKERALRNRRGRARICAHKSSDNPLHEMLIALRADSYVRPHRHLNKVESFHWIEGRADIVILGEQGEVADVIKMGSDHHFYYRLDAPHYHTLIIHSPLLVIHEITQGPFKPNDSDPALFAPNEGNHLEYMNFLKEMVSTNFK